MSYQPPTEEEAAAIRATAKQHAQDSTLTGKAEWTRDEESFLLYAETVAVDHGGKLSREKLNGEDRAILRAWGEERFLLVSGLRIVLSDVAWQAAGLMRRARAERNLVSAE
jgi:hypothetical protein